VFVVRLSDGAKIAEFYDKTNVDDTCAVTHDTGVGVIPADMVGDVTCYSTFPGTFISRCYLGDAAGQLWRLDVGTSDPKTWMLQVLYDPYKQEARPIPSPDRAPAFEAPAVALASGSNQVVIVYGGADQDNLEDVAEKAFVASVTEQPVSLTTSSSTFQCDPYSGANVACQRAGTAGFINYQRFFGYDVNLNLLTGAVAGERMMGPPVIYSSTVYFSTYTPDLVNSCNPGTGRLYGIDLSHHGADCTTFKGEFPSGTTTVDHIDIGPSIPYGVTVVQRPACSQGTAFGPGNVGSASSVTLANLAAPGPQIVAHTSTQATASPSTLPPGSSASPPAVAKMVQTIAAAVQSLFVATWGFLFD
jgi:Tfp pilus tip-associated adhesin PilY1